MFEKALVVYFKDLGRGVVLVWIWPQADPEIKIQEWRNVDFPDGAVVKNPPANAGDTGSSPGPGRSYVLQSN